MTSQSPSTLRLRCVVQAASDLEENRRRQQELAANIETLKQEEALLADILRLAEQYEGVADHALPEQAQHGPVPAARQDTESTLEAAPDSSTTVKATSTGRTARSGAKGKPRQPLLGDLLIDLLGVHDEPRLAKEVWKEFLGRYPDRTPTPQVVRNTLEALVAKGRVRRHKQQQSVMYTLAEPVSHGSATTGAAAD
ncbi:hypothetical protein ACFWOT_38085 [Streptomyces sp. NPDC058440]|uniref:hypothetical protein n=1 Tax=Streptomyces sp. NPDC058440 TaxID=3346501 RepID=UPI0036695CEA